MKRKRISIRFDFLGLSHAFICIRQVSIPKTFDSYEIFIIRIKKNDDHKTMTTSLSVIRILRIYEGSLERITSCPEIEGCRVCAV